MCSLWRVQPRTCRVRPQFDLYRGNGVSIRPDVTAITLAALLPRTQGGSDRRGVHNASRTCCGTERRVRTRYARRGLCTIGFLDRKLLGGVGMLLSLPVAISLSYAVEYGQYTPLYCEVAKDASLSMLPSQLRTRGAGRSDCTARISETAEIRS